MVLASENEMDLSGVSVVLDDEYIDQKNEGGSEEVKVYGGYWYAQDFQPDADYLTGISIYVGKRDSLASNLSDGSLNEMMWRLDSRYPLIQVILNLFQKLRDYSWKYNLKPESETVDLGELTIALYSRSSSTGRPGMELRSISFSPKDIEAEAGWIKCSFFDNPITDRPFVNTYFIVVYAEGGDAEHYYTWKYSSDKYKYGTGFQSEDSGATWKMNRDRDFCFRSYGWDYSEVPDGIEKRWAIVTYHTGLETAFNDCNRIIDIFEQSPKWDSSNIFLYRFHEDYAKLEDKLAQLDQYENKDDVIVFVYIGHGGGYVNFYYLQPYFDNFGSSTVMIVDCCYAGDEVKNFIGGDREILASSKADEESWYGAVPKEGRGCFFTIFLCQALREGYATTRTAFDVAAYRTTSFQSIQHPQFFDGISSRDIELI